MKTTTLVMKKAIFKQFSIRETDDNLTRFRGIRFSILDLMNELAVGESVEVSLVLATISNINRARTLLRPGGKEFSTQNLTGTDFTTITRTC